MVKMGSKWMGSEGKIFCVIGTAEIEGKNWVYYRKEDTKQEPREYSCFVESFLARFTPYTNDR